MKNYAILLKANKTGEDKGAEIDNLKLLFDIVAIAKDGATDKHEKEIFNPVRREYIESLIDKGLIRFGQTDYTVTYIIPASILTSSNFVIRLREKEEDGGYTLTTNGRLPADSPFKYEIGYDDLILEINDHPIFDLFGTANIFDCIESILNFEDIVNGTAFNNAIDKLSAANPEKKDLFTTYRELFRDDYADFKSVGKELDGTSRIALVKIRNHVSEFKKSLRDRFSYEALTILDTAIRADHDAIRSGRPNLNK